MRKVGEDIPSNEGSSATDVSDRLKARGLATCTTELFHKFDRCAFPSDAQFHRGFAPFISLIEPVRALTVFLLSLLIASSTSDALLFVYLQQ